MNRLPAVLNVKVKIWLCEFSLENSGMDKIFNKFVTSCQSESEFVNHFVAASKSRNDVFGIA
jgi:hypothetical protein